MKKLKTITVLVAVLLVPALAGAAAEDPPAEEGVSAPETSREVADGSSGAPERTLDLSFDLSWLEGGVEQTCDVTSEPSLLATDFVGGPLEWGGGCPNGSGCMECTYIFECPPCPTHCFNACECTCCTCICGY